MPNPQNLKKPNTRQNMKEKFAKIHSANFTIFFGFLRPYMPWISFNIKKATNSQMSKPFYYFSKQFQKSTHLVILLNIELFCTYFCWLTKWHQYPLKEAALLFLLPYPAFTVICISKYFVIVHAIIIENQNSHW